MDKVYGISFQDVGSIPTASIFKEQEECMQIQRLHPSDFPPAREASHVKGSVSGTLPLPMREKEPEIIPMVVHREMIEKFSEWYLRMGKAYESTKSYQQAISAYEKSHAVAPTFSKAVSIENLRSKIVEK